MLRFLYFCIFGMVTSVDAQEWETINTGEVKISHTKDINTGAQLALLCLEDGLGILIKHPSLKTNGVTKGYAVVGKNKFSNMQFSNSNGKTSLSGEMATKLTTSLLNSKSLSLSNSKQGEVFTFDLNNGQRDIRKLLTYCAPKVIREG